MRLEDRREGLLKLVGEYRDRECARVLDAARAEARELIAETYRREREQLHGRVLAERKRAKARIQAARAERDSRERSSGERANLRLLDAAWPQLRARLSARWRDREARRIWVAGYLARARELLPSGRWTVRHAPGWGLSERELAVAELTRHLGQAPRIEIDAGMEAGVVVLCRGAVLDASLDGLLRDRTRLEARLLALIGSVDEPPR